MLNRTPSNTPQPGDTLVYRHWKTGEALSGTVTFTSITRDYFVLETLEGKRQSVRGKEILWRSNAPTEQTFDFYQEVHIMVGTHGQTANAVILDIEADELLVATDDEAYLWIAKSDVLQAVVAEVA